ncbi:MAG TPA: alpha-glucan family phosphorylase [Solirubrobacteraceae bacterium]|nr:alpha-glucan family phosphorylase [Solirubrobacteraceae bacterium]
MTASYGRVTMNDGREDIRRAAEDLAERLPEALAPLARIAYNYRWSWLPGGPDVFQAVDAERFVLTNQNPVRLLQEASAAALRRAAADDALLGRIAAVEGQIKADLERPPYPSIDPARPVVFLCAEYGIHVSLPVYSGGLGALAGDLLKEASDYAVPFIAVGLMYRRGYFRQRIDAGGWQHEYWIETDPQRLPAALVTGPGEKPLTIEVPIHDVDVTAQIWRVDVGRVPLFLLDTDIPSNGPVERWITGRLYESDEYIRLAQYALLGAGGVRALTALGIEPGVIHLNEGHAALAPVQLAAQELRSGEKLAAGVAAARERTVFTTHTPVPAGNDTYTAQEVKDAIGRLTRQLGVPVDEVIALGRTNPDDETELFGVTQAALRMSRAANGVSRRHGKVARGMWRSLWPKLEEGAVPIGHVTNGVHIPTWIGAPMRELFDRHLGEGWMTRAADPETWAGVDRIPDAELWEARRRQRSTLVDEVRSRSTVERLLRGDVPGYVRAAADTFDPDVLTIGFARRVATYKRLDLLTRDPQWTLSLLGGERPVQAVLAGKAHPRDEEAKRVLQRLFGMKQARVVGQRVVFLDDYDLASAAWLVRGCDVWLNVPRPPLEASGTSGMKSVVNGGLQLSVLDGWWAEGYDGENGWALPGEVHDDHYAQDERDAAVLHRLLDEEVVPAFYERDGDAPPAAWLARVRASLKTLAPRFSATRMLSEYLAGPYRGS